MPRFTPHLWLALVMFVVFAASFIVYARSERQIDRAHESRQQSYLLVDELRRSSDELTRMARAYVVTGNNLYRQHYQEILDIREGRKPRPVDYQFVYWDLVRGDDQRPRAAGPAVALLELMRRAGFTEGEFARLADAKASSDALTRTEFAAMNVIDSTDPSAVASRATAIATLYDAAYYQAKADFMRPIGDFQRLADQRTLAALHDATVQATRMRLTFILFGMVLVFLLWRVQRKLQEEVAAQKLRAEITLHSIGDGVITTDADERIEFLNPVAEQLSGWAASECEGRQVTEILKMIDAKSGKTVATPLRQALAEKRIVSFGRDVDLVRRDGSRIGIDDSAAPICAPDGEVTGGVMIFRDVSEARALTHQRSWEAAHDPLTGLVNRREFERLLEVSVAIARTDGRHHVVCFMDLDQFKVVNDTCGHAVGDDLLKELTAALQSRIRKSDTLARLGGDEFGLLLDGCSLERAQFIAADLLAAVGDFRFHGEAKVFTVGVSIGLAAVTGDSTSSAEILSMADTACYWAKEQGRNRVCVYQAGDSDMATRRRELSWIARINSALAEGRFTFYHQTFLPLNAAAGTRSHIEVLLRMVDEEGNQVQPGSFLPAAERYNLMPAIDRWVVGAMFARYHAVVAERGGKPLTCAINLSGTSLNEEGFLDFVRQQAREHALPPQSICFEITETAAINNLRTAVDFVRACKSMGFLFALDDFGTGASSFGYLKHLPVDYLKIDGGFVKNLQHDAIDKAMTETINRIGHIMGIKTVAEYAENDALITELKHMGVDYAQGYGVDIPTPLFESDRDPVLHPRGVAVARRVAHNVVYKSSHGRRLALRIKG